MGKGGWTADPNQITVPPGATPDDPRIVIGGEDPIAESLSQDAAIVLYFGPGRAFVISVEQSGGPDYGQLHIWSVDPVNPVLRQYWDISHDVLGDTATFNMGGQGVSSALYGAEGITEIASNSDSDNPTHDLRAFDVSLPRGFRNRAAALASTAGIVAETVTLTSASRTYWRGRAYEIRMVGGITSTTVNISGLFRIRKTNLAGQVLGEYFRYPTQVAGTPYNANGSGRIFRVYEFGADVTTAIVLTLQGIGGTVGHYANVDSPRVFDIFDVGAEADFPDAPYLV